MADTKRPLHLHAPSAVAPSSSSSSTAPPPPPQPSPTPQMSPVPGRSAGRRMHTKVLEELKNVTSRGKSPALAPSSGSGNGPLPSPLHLNTVSAADTLDTDYTDGSSPRLPTTSVTMKNKCCGLCERSFTVFRAKHTCKMCQQKICDDCSKNRVKLNRRLERRKGSRLCDVCARDHLHSAATPVLSAVDTATTPPLDTKNAAAFALGGCHPHEDDHPPGVAVHHATTRAEGLRRATSSVFFSAATSGLTRECGGARGASHLHSRHWLSFAGFACLLFVRVMRASAPSSLEATDPLARGLGTLLLSLTNWIDRLVSLRFIFTYVVGLVAYDELLAHKPPRNKTDGPIVGSSSTTLVARKRLRTRTRSAVSETARSTPVVVSVATPPFVRAREEDEVLEVEVGDKPIAADGVGFTFDKLAASLVDCTLRSRVDDNQMKMSAFLASCEYVCGFILVFGKATAFAASTVTGYMSTIATNLAAWPVPPSATSVAFSWKEQSVRAVIQREVELNVASTGGKKKPSCARCVLRLLWFIEFVETCVRYTLVENEAESCSAGASKAYEETIGTRHPWIIRKGVISALGSLPSRSAILESLNLHHLPADEATQQLRHVQTAMRVMLDEVTALLKEHNLMDIK